MAAKTLTAVEYRRGRMNYPEFRRLGLPINSALVESGIKQLNRRVKRNEKCWMEPGAEAFLQVCENGRAENNWKRPCPHRRVAGGGRLRRSIAASQ